MTPTNSSRSQRTPAERNVRSRLVKQCATSSLLRGSLVKMRRECGYEGCLCAQGQLHESLYLSIRVKKRRKLVFIPAALEAQVREWVASGQEVIGLVEVLSQLCLEQLLNAKETHSGPRKPRRPRKGKSA